MYIKRFTVSLNLPIQSQAARTAKSVQTAGNRLDGLGLNSPQARYFSLLQNVHIGSRAHPTSYSMGNGILSYS
jgi:hypothetical protein